MSYVCKEYDATTLACLEWSPQEFLPSLTIADGLELATAILLLWVVAFGVRLVFNLIINRR